MDTLQWLLSLQRSFIQDFIDKKKYKKKILVSYVTGLIIRPGRAPGRRWFELVFTALPRRGVLVGIPSARAHSTHSFQRPTPSHIPASHIIFPDPPGWVGMRRCISPQLKIGKMMVLYLVIHKLGNGFFFFIRAR